jgi:hypothetical protein
MRAPITFAIGLAVALLGTGQFLFDHSPIRLLTVVLGLFFLVFGWLVGWTRFRGFTILLGHLAITAGCLVTAYAIYQIPGMKTAPTLLEVLDLPLFWGLFTLFGGVCMIQHGSCACCIRRHDRKTGPS